MVPPSGTTRPRRKAGQDQAEPAGIFDGETAAKPIGAGVVIVEHALQAGHLRPRALETFHHLANLVGFGRVFGVIDPDDRPGAWSARSSGRAAWS